MNHPPRTRWQRVRGHWYSSLRLRVVVSTVIVGLLALVVLGGVVSTSIRAGLFEERRDEILADAVGRSEQMQSLFDDQLLSAGSEVEEFAFDVLRSLYGSGSGSVGMMLLRSPEATSQVRISDPITDQRLYEVLTPELRQAVRGDGSHHWQSISLPDSMGGAPGIIVGSSVNLPIAGSYELYSVYSLASQEATLLLVMRVLALGAGALVLLLVIMTWHITRRVLGPLGQTARSAARLADGLLDERLPVQGKDEIATLARSFNEMATSLQRQIERLGELSRLQQRFVSDVSHELRTPLTTIRMASEVLHASRDDFDPATRRAAELLHAQLDRFESMLADLLEISRFDAGAAALEIEEHDVVQLVRRVVEVAAPLAERAGSVIRVRGPGRPCIADIDARRVERVVRNLVLNAIEHGEGAPVDIFVGVNATAVAVRVRDYGVGMTEEARDHVFDRFWRADPARARTTGGTGLGLAISLEDARLHGGTLEAWGSPGRGAAFLLTLPRHAGVVATESPLDLEPPPPEFIPRAGATDSRSLVTTDGAES